MIRRLFWVGLGVMVGVSGYRRVSRLARAAGIGGRTGAGARGRAGLARARGAALFARDVREGMDLYADRHPRLAGRTLEGQRAGTQRPQGAAPDEQRRRPAYPGIDYAKDGR
ncbi:MAG TPA: hypothetical protein VMC03_14950 [Streptosporangiaceae bacterium]|nr:hypothetical protein [Streptosporangiaceae bacterium]